MARVGTRPSFLLFPLSGRGDGEMMFIVPEGERSRLTPGRVDLWLNPGDLTSNEDGLGYVACFCELDQKILQIVIYWSG